LADLSGRAFSYCPFSLGFKAELPRTGAVWDGSYAVAAMADYSSYEESGIDKYKGTLVAFVAAS